VFYARSGIVPAMTPGATSQPKTMGPDQGAAEERRVVLMERANRRRRALTNLAPLLLILCSIGSYILYFWQLDVVIRDLQVVRFLSRDELLKTWGAQTSIPSAAVLQASYIGIFLFAEAAFVVMALREYAYGVLKISESEVLGADAPNSAAAVATMSSGDSPVSDSERANPQS
jgi:hypothetical protein